MDDLISRQAAIDAMNAKLEDIKLRWKGKVKKGEIAMYLDMRGTIETLPSAQPTVDAVPVRHGKWISNSPVTMRCNQCTYVASDWIAHEFHYCPNCGARMDEE